MDARSMWEGMNDTGVPDVRWLLYAVKCDRGRTDLVVLPGLGEGEHENGEDVENGSGNLHMVTFVIRE